MSIAFNSIKGLTFLNSKKAYHGFTLITPVDGTGVWLIDMMGRLVNYWEMGFKPGCYGELLPNGNLLYVGKVETGLLADLEGTGGILLEVDWDGNEIWRYEDPYLHHAFYRMQNGNTLVLKWVEVPSEIVDKVKGGNTGTEREGVMWGDAIQEITSDGKIAWEWIGHEHLAPEIDVTCPLCPRSTWTHANAIFELPDGNILTSFMKNDTIAILDKKTGDIKWRWGQNELAHPHCPTILDNGNILVFDSGLHQRPLPFGFSRVIEINPLNGDLVWAFGGEEERELFYSATMSSCQRLPNRNTLICEGTRGRLLEVDTKGALVWEYVNELPLIETSPIQLRSYPVYAAFRYGIDYSGLKRPVSILPKRQPMPGMEAKKGTTVQSRVANLGY